MPNIKSFLTLQDNASKPLNNIFSAAMKNVKSFLKLDDAMETVTRTTYEWTDAVGNYRKDALEMMYTNEELVEQGFKVANTYEEQIEKSEDLDESSGKLNLTMTEINQTLEIAQKAWRTLTQVIQEASKWMQISNNQFNAEFSSAIKMHGVLGATEEEISSMYRYSEALQKVGVVGDDAALSGMSTLTMYADNIEQVEKLIPAILDLAVAENGLNTTQGNVESAAQRVGYALNGNATMLKRMIGATDAEIKTLNNMNDKTKKAEYLFKLLESRVGGANETLAKTAQGGMMAADNALGDLQERLGTQVVPYFAKFKEILVDILTPIVDFAEANSSWLIPTILSLIGAIGALIAILTVYKVIGLVTAAVNWAMATPLLLAVGLIVAFVFAINMAAKALSEWSGTTVSAVGLIMGALNVMWTFVQNLFIDLHNGAMAMANGLAVIFIGLEATVIGVLDAIAAAIDFVFGSNLQATTSAWLDKAASMAKSIAEDPGYIERKSYSEAFDAGYDFGDNLFEGVDVSGATTGNLSDWLSGMDNINKNLDGMIGTDSTGGKALKTTTNDNLLSDEDVQMLLDIATRDYQLNYQQVTPNVTVTFGDVRETADVNQVLDVVGTRIEELIYGDAEVVY